MTSDSGLRLDNLRDEQTARSDIKRDTDALDRWRYGAEMRELVRAKLKAKAALDAAYMVNVADKSEDERIDLELECRRLFLAWDAACSAIYAFERSQVSIIPPIGDGEGPGIK